MERRLEIAGENLALFGAKIPSEALRTLGIFVLASLVLYLMLHTVQLNALIANGRERPKYLWIALFRDKLSRSASAATLLLFPAVLGVSLWLHVMRAQRWEDSHVNWWDACLATIGFIFLAFSLFWLCTQLRLLWKCRIGRSQERWRATKRGQAEP